jgi:uridylate kinase
MKTIVISLGGSVLLSKEADAAFLQNLVTLLHNHARQNKLFIVVGGGPIAREYIHRARELKVQEHLLDDLGITVTRINAQFLSLLLKKANKEIPHTTKQAQTYSTPIVVMGGTKPGHSTDMVGAELAENLHADLFIIATNVNGIYDKDPRHHKDACQLKEITIDSLISHFGTHWKSAGKNMVIDGPALAIIKRARLPTRVVNGKRLEQLENVLLGKSFDGTTLLV